MKKKESEGSDVGVERADEETVAKLKNVATQLNDRIGASFLLLRARIENAAPEYRRMVGRKSRRASSGSDSDIYRSLENGAISISRCIKRGAAARHQHTQSEKPRGNHIGGFMTASPAWRHLLGARDKRNALTYLSADRCC